MARMIIRIRSGMAMGSPQLDFTLNSNLRHPIQMHLAIIIQRQFFLIKYYLAKIQYYTTVCMIYHKPNPSAEHVDAMKIANSNGYAE